VRKRFRLWAQNGRPRASWQRLVLQRRHPRPRLGNADRWFWIVASSWRCPLLNVKPETVLRWHRRGWRAYWSWRSRRPRGGGAVVARFPRNFHALIRRMTAENRLWGQRRIQAQLARLGFMVSARIVAKYMNSRPSRGPSSGWRKFLKRHELSIWACDFFCVQMSSGFPAMALTAAVRRGSSRLRSSL
jgi:putative transposase